MKILSENSGPIILSASTIECDLPLNLEHEAFLKMHGAADGSLFLRFENIFGSVRCPDFDLLLCDPLRPEPQVYLGALTVTDAPARSLGYFHGAAQTVSLDSRTTDLAINGLLSSRRLTLRLQSQRSPVMQTGAVVELAYLCLQTSGDLHGASQDF